MKLRRIQKKVISLSEPARPILVRTKTGILPTEQTPPSRSVDPGYSYTDQFTVCRGTNDPLTLFKVHPDGNTMVCITQDNAVVMFKTNGLSHISVKQPLPRYGFKMGQPRRTIIGIDFLDNGEKLVIHYRHNCIQVVDVKSLSQRLKAKLSREIPQPKPLQEIVHVSNKRSNLTLAAAVVGALSSDQVGMHEVWRLYDTGKVGILPVQVGMPLTSCRQPGLEQDEAKGVDKPKPFVLESLLNTRFVMGDAQEGNQGPPMEPTDLSGAAYSTKTNALSLTFKPGSQASTDRAGKLYLQRIPEHTLSAFSGFGNRVAVYEPSADTLHMYELLNRTLVGSVVVDMGAEVSAIALSKNGELAWIGTKDGQVKTVCVAKQSFGSEMGIVSRFAGPIVSLSPLPATRVMGPGKKSPITGLSFLVRHGEIISRGLLEGPEGAIQTSLVRYYE